MKIKHRSGKVALAAVSLVALGAAAAAIADAPKPGARYIGDVPESIVVNGHSRHHGARPFEVDVSKSGKTVARFRANYSVPGCGHLFTYTRRTAPIPINHGKFARHGRYTTPHTKPPLKNRVRLGGRFVHGGNAVHVRFHDTFNKSSGCATVSMRGTIPAK